MKQQILFILTGTLWINLAFAQPIIIIFGSEDSLSVKKQVAQYLDHLDVQENVHLSIGFSTQMPEKLEGMTFCLNAPTPNTYQVIRVWIDARLDKTRQRLVLAHEMIHVKQLVKGELIVMSNQQVMWKGQKYRSQGANNRRIAPWEIEAYRNDDQLAKLCKEQPELPLTVSRTNALH